MSQRKHLFDTRVCTYRTVTRFLQDTLSTCTLPKQQLPHPENKKCRRLKYPKQKVTWFFFGCETVSHPNEKGVDTRH
jgi:hypothetical protein